MVVIRQILRTYYDPIMQEESWDFFDITEENLAMLRSLDGDLKVVNVDCLNFDPEVKNETMSSSQLSKTQTVETDENSRLAAAKLKIKKEKIFRFAVKAADWFR